MNEILFEILKAVIIVSIMVGMRYIVPLVRENTELAKNQMISDIVTAAVQYAEQTIKSGTGAGAEKKAIVTEFLKKQLKAKNIALSDEQIDTLIESAVYAMNSAKK